MKKKLIASVLTATLVMGMACTGWISVKGASKLPNEEAKLKKKISTMTYEEKIGQMLMFGVQSTKVDSQTRQLFEDQHIGGVILYGWRNFAGESLKDNGKYVNALKKANSDNSNIPLFVAFDEEGGALSHLSNDILKIPSKGEIGNLNDSDLAGELASATGRKLSSLGINVDFGTVLDINTNPNNPIIGFRSYGATKEKVTEFGMKELDAIRNEKVIPTAKHFPGHGDTDTDSHLGLPSVNHDINRLKSTELVPFQNAIDNGLDMMMTAHIVVSQVDSEYPATLSKKVLTDLLRNEMKYNGVVITDDLEMQAIANNWDLGDAALMSVNAGSDILLVCHTVENQQKVYNSLVQAVNDGKLSEKRLDESVLRILKLKAKYELSDAAVKPMEGPFPEVNNYVYEKMDKYYKKVIENMYKN